MKVTQDKLDRLWGHFLKLEELTGERLREKPRGKLTDCPILNFAPDKYRDESFKGVESGGAVIYGIVPCEKVTFNILQLFYHPKYTFDIYEYLDSLWWGSLPIYQRRRITRWVENKIKEHYECGG